MFKKSEKRAILHQISQKNVRKCIEKLVKMCYNYIENYYGGKKLEKKRNRIVDRMETQYRTQTYDPQRSTSGWQDLDNEGIRQGALRKLRIFQL